MKSVNVTRTYLDLTLLTKHLIPTGRNEREETFQKRDIGDISRLTNYTHITKKKKKKAWRTDYAAKRIERMTSTCEMIKQRERRNTCCPRITRPNPFQRVFFLSSLYVTISSVQSLRGSCSRGETMLNCAEQFRSVMKIT